MSKITNYISNQKPSKIIIIITISVILITLILSLPPIFTDILLIINIIFTIILSWNIITEISLIQETSLREVVRKLGLNKGKKRIVKNINF